MEAKITSDGNVNLEFSSVLCGSSVFLSSTLNRKIRWLVVEVGWSNDGLLNLHQILDESSTLTIWAIDDRSRWWSTWLLPNQGLSCLYLLVLVSKVLCDGLNAMSWLVECSELIGLNDWLDWMSADNLRRKLIWWALRFMVICWFIQDG